MSSPPLDAPAPPATRRSLHWLTLAVSVAVAAAAMVATLPGRTHGLGLITESLLADLHLGRVPYAALNLWATLLGAAFCLPCGWLLDRVGVRPVLTAILLALGVVVIGMARVTADSSAQITLPAPEVFAGRGVEWVAVPLDLFLLVLLTRGLGQSALSVASLALVGKAAGKRPGPVIGVYSFLVAVGFMAAFMAIKYVVEQWHTDWRTVWAGIGWALVLFAGFAVLFARSPQPTPDEDSAEAASTPEAGETLWQAVRTPAFWVFGLATSFYGLVAAGLSLFHQSILAERGFDPTVFRTIVAISPMIGLAANLLTGALAHWVRMSYLLAAAILLMAGTLAAFPYVSTLAEVYAYAAGMGVAGGMVTVIFFAVWRQLYGTAHLGQIQGAAQLLTVLASALGPLILAGGQRAFDSYAPVIQTLAVVSLAFGVVACLVPLPARGRTGEPQ
jgi:MFS family permease